MLPVIATDSIVTMQLERGCRKHRETSFLMRTCQRQSKVLMKVARSRKGTPHYLH